MSKLRGIASIILSQALLVLMMFQSANGGILVLVENEAQSTELPLEEEARESETEISASLLSSPILNRGDSNNFNLGEAAQGNDSGTFEYRDLAEPNHPLFSKENFLDQSRFLEPSIHIGSIATLGP